MSRQENSKRSILKQLLAGQLTAERAALELRKANGEPIPFLIVVEDPEGRYTVGNEQDLLEQQMRERIKGHMHVIVGPEVAKLGSVIE